ncbi:hypothetical protein BaRGS_00012258, partial [Batillaria attramentaria]
QQFFSLSVRTCSYGYILSDLWSSGTNGLVRQRRDGSADAMQLRRPCLLAHWREQKTSPGCVEQNVVNLNKVMQQMRVVLLCVRRLQWKPDFLNADDVITDIQHVMQSFIMVLEVDGTVVFVSPHISQLLGRSETGLLWEIVEAGNTSQECVTYHNLDGTFLYADSRWCRHVGYMPDELSGCSHYDFVHPEDLQVAALAHHRVLTQDTEVCAVYRMCTRGYGDEIVCARSRLAFHPHSGQPRFILTLTTMLGESQGHAMLACSQRDVLMVKKDPAQSWLLDDFPKVLSRLTALRTSLGQHVVEAQLLTLATTGEGDLVSLHSHFPLTRTSEPRGRPRGSRSRAVLTRTTSLDCAQGRGRTEEKSRQQIQRWIFEDKLGGDFAPDESVHMVYDEPLRINRDPEIMHFSQGELGTISECDGDGSGDRCFGAKYDAALGVRLAQQDTDKCRNLGMTHSVGVKQCCPLPVEIECSEADFGNRDLTSSTQCANQSILKNILKGRIQSPLSSGRFASSPGAASSPGSYAHDMDSASLGGRQNLDSFYTGLPENCQKLQVVEQAGGKEQVMGRWSQREMDELQVFSAQLYGKHVHMEHSLAAQDSILQQVEEQLQKHMPATNESALYHQLHHRLQNIKFYTVSYHKSTLFQASRTEQQEELQVLRSRFQQQLQQQLQTTTPRRLAIVPPLPRSAASPMHAASHRTRLDCDTTGDLSQTRHDSCSDLKQHKVKKESVFMSQADIAISD